jgi:DNA-binding FadR family transcriptional regulator
VGRKPGSQRGRGLHGQLVQQLGQMIVSGELGVDRPLVPEEIGHRFEVSRTVVRESLRVLEAKGLVSARPNVGTRVRPVSDWNLLDPDVIEWRAFGPQSDEQRRELLELRLSFEPLATRLTASRNDVEVQHRLSVLYEAMKQAVAHSDFEAFAQIDTEFHATLVQAAGNRMLEHLYAIVASALYVSGGHGVSCERLSDNSLALHGRIVEAVSTGDSTMAEHAVRSLLAVQPEAERLFPTPREEG